VALIAHKSAERNMTVSFSYHCVHIALVGSFVCVRIQQLRPLILPVLHTAPAWGSVFDQLLCANGQ
jgi:hypothetical protein